MSLTHLDCHLYQGKRINFDQSGFTALNPTSDPGSLVIVGAAAARENLNCQIGARLALERFIKGVLDFYDFAYDDLENISEQALESAFRFANTEVYNFGAERVPRSKAATSLVAVSIKNDVISAGRIGSGAVYLYRDKELLPFFAELHEGHSALDSYLGSQAMTSVDLATIPAQGSDVIYIFSGELSSDEQAVLYRIAAETSEQGYDPCEEIVHSLYRNEQDVGFLMHAQIGPEAIFLNQSV